MKRLIITDSSSNRHNMDYCCDYKSAPLKIITSKEYIDDENLNVEEMVLDFETHNEKSSTSCPSVGEWLQAFEGYDEIFAVTISSKLSGSYHSCMMARDEYLDEHPDAKIEVFDSCEAGAGLTMFTDKINQLIKEGFTFEEIVRLTYEYKMRTKLAFLLNSANNLANNGRLSPLIAKLIGVLDIKLLGRATEGVIDNYARVKGIKRALRDTYREMVNQGFDGGKVFIDYVIGEENALKLNDLIKQNFPDAQVIIDTCKGLCSYYAERNGLIIAYEINTQE